jgi:hypothetical protein
MKKIFQPFNIENRLNDFFKSSEWIDISNETYPYDYFPKDLTTINANVIIREDSKIKKIPDNFTVVGSLGIQSVDSLKEFPKNLKVLNSLFLTGSQFSVIPGDLVVGESGDKGYFGIDRVYACNHISPDITVHGSIVIDIDSFCYMFRNTFPEVEKIIPKHDDYLNYLQGRRGMSFETKKRLANKLIKGYFKNITGKVVIMDTVPPEEYDRYELWFDENRTE